MIIDTSKWNGLIDWQKVKAENSTLEGVYLKSDEGVNAVDSMVKTNAINATKAGISIGYYHFATLNNHDEVQDANNEAIFLDDLLKQLPVAQLPLALDIEENKGALSKDEVNIWIETFFEKIEALGHKDYVIYSYASFLNSNLPANHKLGRVRLWLAAYNDHPVLPHGWTSFWHHQYTNKGNVSGIKGNTDISK